MASFQAKIGWKRLRKREIKIIVPFRSFPTRRVIENSKNIEKKFKKLNITIMAPFRAKISGKSIKEGENKNYRLDRKSVV